MNTYIDNQKIRNKVAWRQVLVGSIFLALSSILFAALAVYLPSRGFSVIPIIFDSLLGLGGAFFFLFSVLCFDEPAIFDMIGDWFD